MMPAEVKRSRVPCSVAFIILIMVCVLTLVSCKDSSIQRLISFQSGYYCKTGNIYHFYLVYDLHSDSKQTYKMSKNGDMRNNVTLALDNWIAHDLSLSDLSYEWAKAFGEHGQSKYEEGCDRDIVLAAGTNETIPCASIFAFSIPESLDENTEFTLTSHLLPEEQTLVIPFSSLQEVKSPTEINDFTRSVFPN